jgi:hypothetical protein
MALTIFKGTRSPSYVDTLTYLDVNGVERPFDLTTVTSVKLQGRFEGALATDALKIDAAATVVNAAAGQVQYNWAAADVDTTGTMFLWWHVTLASGLTQDSPETELIVQEHGVRIADIRDFVETGISDAALALMESTATEEVINRFGDDSVVTERFYGAYGTTIRLNRPATSITSVIERDSQLVALGTPLAVGLDYDLLHSGRTLVRLTGGPWAAPYWRYIVDVIYTPKTEANARRRLVIDLVKLEVQYSGLSSEMIGDYSSNMMDRTGGSTTYYKEREKLFASFSRNRGYRYR